MCFNVPDLRPRSDVKQAGTPCHSLHTVGALLRWRAGSERVVYDSAWHVVTLSSPQPSRKVEQYCAKEGQASLLLCFVLTCYCSVTVIMADKTSTIRTRKFMNNQLLRRKQFVSDVSRSAYNSQNSHMESFGC